MLKNNFQNWANIFWLLLSSWLSHQNCYNLELDLILNLPHMFLISLTLPFDYQWQTCINVHNWRRGFFQWRNFTFLFSRFKFLIYNDAVGVHFLTTSAYLVFQTNLPMWSSIYHRFLLVRFQYLFSDYAGSLNFFFLFFCRIYCYWLIHYVSLCNRQDGVNKFR